MSGLAGSWGRGASRWVALLGMAMVGVMVAAACGGSGSSSGSSATSHACGQDVSYVGKIKDPDGVFKQLPANVQERYGPWPYSVRATPWETFKGKPPPWKIGLITF